MAAFCFASITVIAMLALPRVALISSALKRFSTACSGNISKPLCRFGMIADVQYAGLRGECPHLLCSRAHFPPDIDDDKNFSGMELRSYRGSLAVVERASKAWQLQPHSFILQLGDIIDGQNSGKYGQGLTKFSPCGSQSDVALRRVLDLFSKYGWSGDKIYSAVGNHEFYCWPDRSVLASKIPQLTASSSADSSDQLFQSFSPAPGWRVIVLDAYDVAIIGRPPGSSEFNQAIDLLRSKNPNISEDGSATANFLTNLCVSLLVRRADVSSLVLQRWPIAQICAL
jgi:manganese-dependent ADP-ribose/CDP-alcohol diphosphatase